jgi:hypothetical protein
MGIKHGEKKFNEILILLNSTISKGISLIILNVHISIVQKDLICSCVQMLTHHLKLSRYRILKDFVSLNLKLCKEDGVYINSFWIRDHCIMCDENVFIDSNPNKQRDILAQKLFS